MRKIQLTLAKALAEKWARVFTHILSETILVIIGIESDFRPDVKNTNERAMVRGGAWGYMGMTLQTATDLASKLRSKSMSGASATAIRDVLRLWDGSGQSLLHPDLNVALGAYYLDRLAEEFHDPDLVVAAYHQGPGNIRKKLAAKVPKAQILAELPPFGQEYVNRALAMREALRSGKGIA